MKKLTIIGLFLFLCCLPANLCLGADEAKSDKILAQVGEKTFTNSQLEAMAQSLPPQLQAMLASNPQIKKELINRWVDITILVKEAEAMKLDKEKAIRLKLDDLRSRVLVDALIDKRVSRATSIPETEIKAYYDSHPMEFEKGEQIRAQHILIRVDQNAGPEVEAKAKKTIEMLARKLKDGASFASLAEEYSEDPGSKINGGDLGFFGRGQMVKEFEEAAFATKLNQVSPPIRTAFGYHLIKVNEKKAPGKVPFEEVKKKIETTMLADKNRTALNDLVSELKKKYEVKIF
jgi:peptidyl-prolyl cis-trans isomerase C